MFREMEQWNRIRQRVLREGVSLRQIQRETGLHHSTIKKILAFSSPPRGRVSGPGQAQAGGLFGADRCHPSGREGRPDSFEAAAYDQADLRAASGGGVHRRVYPGEVVSP